MSPPSRRERGVAGDVTDASARARRAAPRVVDGSGSRPNTIPHRRSGPRSAACRAASSTIGPRGVDQVSGGFHQRQFGGADESLVPAEHGVDGQDVRVGEQLLLVHGLHRLLGRLVGEVLAPGDDVHGNARAMEATCLPGAPGRARLGAALEFHSDVVLPAAFRMIRSSADVAVSANINLRSALVGAQERSWAAPAGAAHRRCARGRQVDGRVVHPAGTSSCRFGSAARTSRGSGALAHRGHHLERLQLPTSSRGRRCLEVDLVRTPVGVPATPW